MPLCRRVCEECFRRRGHTLSAIEWVKYLRVWCPEGKGSDDTGGNIPTYRTPPNKCLFLAEHAIMAEDYE